MPQRESLEMDVLIVGAGTAGLATALHLAQLIEKYNAEIDSGARLGRTISTAQISLDMDVLMVGAGPAGLATALHLAQLIEKYNAEIDSGARQGRKLSTEEIY